MLRVILTESIKHEYCVMVINTDTKNSVDTFEGCAEDAIYVAKELAEVINAENKKEWNEFLQYSEKNINKAKAAIEGFQSDSYLYHHYWVFDPTCLKFYEIRKQNSSKNICEDCGKEFLDTENYGICENCYEKRMMPFYNDLSADIAEAYRKEMHDDCYKL